MLVDDYDLVATQQSSPLAVLQPLMAQARDVGLHVVVARRSGGASRAMYEPVIQSMRDLAMPGLLLSGSPEEGPLLGQAAPPARLRPAAAGCSPAPAASRRSRWPGPSRPVRPERPSAPLALGAGAEHQPALRRWRPEPNIPRAISRAAVRMKSLKAPDWTTS